MVGAGGGGGDGGRAHRGPRAWDGGAAARYVGGDGDGGDGQQRAAAAVAADRFHKSLDELLARMDEWAKRGNGARLYT